MSSAVTQSQERIAIDTVHAALDEVLAEIRKAYVGQDALVRQVLIGLLCRGNVLLEGLPGLGKTLLVRVLARALDLEFNRIQFTPDLMPADITGTESLVRSEGEARLVFRPGPIFANIVLADEINRATPKTQSALLEAMQEHTVTVSGVRHELDEPFFVLATQNPVEMEGTYPLPEAQLDRFLFKLDVPFPSDDELRAIGLMTTSAVAPAEVRPALDRAGLIAAQDLVREIVVSPEIADAAVRLTVASHPSRSDAPELVREYVRYGASPRALQALLLASRANALLEGRAWVSSDDLKAIAAPVLGHRVVLGYEAELDGIGSVEVVSAVIERL